MTPGGGSSARSRSSGSSRSTGSCSPTATGSRPGWSRRRAPASPRVLLSTVRPSELLRGKIRDRVFGLLQLLLIAVALAVSMAIGRLESLRCARGRRAGPVLVRPRVLLLREPVRGGRRDRDAPGGPAVDDDAAHDRDRRFFIGIAATGNLSSTLATLAASSSVLVAARDADADRARRGRAVGGRVLDRAFRREHRAADPDRDEGYARAVLQPGRVKVRDAPQRLILSPGRPVRCRTRCPRGRP